MGRAQMLAGLVLVCFLGACNRFEPGAYKGDGVVTRTVSPPGWQIYFEGFPLQPNQSFVGRYRVPHPPQMERCILQLHINGGTQAAQRELKSQVVDVVVAKVPGTADSDIVWVANGSLGSEWLLRETGATSSVLEPASRPPFDLVNGDEYVIMVTISRNGPIEHSGEDTPLTGNIAIVQR